MRVNVNTRLEILLSIILRGGSYGLYAALVPKYVEYFGGNLETSGKWFVFISTCNWLLAIDLGIGNSLRNRLIKLNAKNQIWLIPATVIAGTLANVLIALVLWVLSIVLIDSFDYANRYGSQWNSAFKVLVSAICVQFVVRTVVFVHYSKMRTYVSSMFNLATNVLLYFAMEYNLADRGNVVYLSIAYGIAINLPIVLSVITMMSKRTKLPNNSMLVHINGKRIGKNVEYLIKNGGVFFANQILYLSIIQVNPIAISSLNGSSSVVAYTALSTVFFVPIILVNLIGNSVWGRVAHSVSSGDLVWASNALNRTLKISLFLVFGTALGAGFYTELARYWWSSMASPVDDQFAVFIFFIYTAALIFQTTVSNFACAIQKLSIQRNFYIILLVFKGFYFLCAQKVMPIDWHWILVSDTVILFMYSLYQIKILRKEFS